MFEANALFQEGPNCFEHLTTSVLSHDIRYPYEFNTKCFGWQTQQTARVVLSLNTGKDSVPYKNMISALHVPSYVNIFYQILQL